MEWSFKSSFLNGFEDEIRKNKDILFDGIIYRESGGVGGELAENRPIRLIEISFGDWDSLREEEELYSE